MRIILTAIILSLFAQTCSAQNNDDSASVKKRIVHVIDSTYPRYTHLVWKSKGRATFEDGDYFYQIMRWNPDSIVIKPCKVGKVILSKFDSIYPNAIVFAWYSVKDSLMGASFNCKCKAGVREIEFDKEGNVVFLEGAIKLDDAPKKIRAYLKKNYRGFNMNKNLGFTEKKGKMEYGERISKYPIDSFEEPYYFIRFDKDGNFLEEKFYKGEGQ